MWPRSRNESYLLTTHGSDDHVTLGILALRMSGNISVIDKSKVNKTTLIGVHRLETNLTRTLGTRSSRPSNRLNLLLPTILVALNVNNDGEVEAKTLTNDRRDDELKSVEHATVAANENCQVTAINVENELSLVTIVLIDGGLSLTKALEDITNHANGEVGDGVKLVVAKLFISLVGSSNLSKGIARDNLLGLLVLLDRVIDDFVHGYLHLGKAPTQ